MEKNKLKLTAANFMSTDVINEKRIWISPNINSWDISKLENGLGKGGDGASHTYAF